jgi:hypothetical protein
MANTLTHSQLYFHPSNHLPSRFNKLMNAQSHTQIIGEPLVAAVQDGRGQCQPSQEVTKIITRGTDTEVNCEESADGQQF